MWRSYKERVHALSRRLVEAQRPIRVLDALKWGDEIEEQFVARKGRDLPKVDAAWYRDQRPLKFDPEAKIAEFEAIRRDLDIQLGQDDALGAIVHRYCLEYQDVVRMLCARGTTGFYEYSRRLYGSPKDHLLDERTTLAELGHMLYDILNGIEEDRLGVVLPRVLTGEQVVDQLNARFGEYFGDCVVAAKLDDGILSDAAAGADYVKIRADQMFSQRDVDVFEVHEGWVHVGTNKNGERQHVATWLSKGPPSTAAIQEGLAVLMEIFTFRASPRRAHALNNRILACEKAEDGADFVELVEFYRCEGYAPRDCFRHAQRVVRGGVVGGGAPFTKDIVYCRGFVEIYNFLRTAIRLGRPELIPFLFVGKVALDDLPALYQKHREGVIDAPTYLPPQFRDLNGLAMWLAYSNFFNRIDLTRVQDYYRARLGA